MIEKPGDDLDLKNKKGNIKCHALCLFSLLSALISSEFRQMGVGRWTLAGQSGHKQTGRKRDRMTGRRTRQYVAMATSCNGLVHKEYTHIYSKLTVVPNKVAGQPIPSLNAASECFTLPCAHTMHAITFAFN